jgi:hypothetical protein
LEDDSVDWESFGIQYMEDGYSDWEDRIKTAEAMKRLCERVPSEVFEHHYDVTFFAPAPWKNGQVYPRGFGGSNAVIYLSPTLEGLPQEEVDFIVAHEFAHANLGHDNYFGNIDSIEDEADALAAKWGFVVPERRKVSR